MNQKPMLILIAGGTAAGKSALPGKLGDCLKDGISIVSTDDFAKESIFEDAPLGEKEEEFYYELIWYRSDTLDWDLLFEKLKKLLQQEDIYVNPDQAESEGTKKLIKATPIIVVEGVHALQNEQLRNMADLKIYSHTDDSIRLIFKIARSPWYKKMVGEKPRDTRNFGGTTNSLSHAFKCWWRGTIKAEKEHVIPTQKYADIIITYNEMENLPENTELLHILTNLYFNHPEEFTKKLQDLKEQGKNGEKERVFAPELTTLRAKNKLNSLHSLIKELSTKKGRKIKVIVDWDDCVQPVKPMAIYTEANPQLSIPFKEFFNHFWEGTKIATSSLWTNEIDDYQGTEEEKVAVMEFEKRREQRKNNPRLYLGSFYDSAERFNAPLTSLADDLLKCLKEDLISELAIFTSFRKPEENEHPQVKEFLKREIALKKAKINKVFGDWPQFKLEYSEVGKRIDGGNKPHRWEVIQDHYSDFDLYVNDNSHQIISAWERLGKDKHYALNDYLCNRSTNSPNIYHIKTTLSDLTDEEISQAAKAKYGDKSRINKPTTNQSTVKGSTAPAPNYAIWISLAIGGIALLGLVSYFLFKKKK